MLARRFELSSQTTLAIERCNCPSKPQLVKVSTGKLSSIPINESAIPVVRGDTFNIKGLNIPKYPDIRKRILGQVATHFDHTDAR